MFLEDHNKKTIWSEVDYPISLNPDYLQFMELGPVPGTALYEDYDNKGKLIDEIPHEEKHGQDKIWFKHDNFTREESSEYLRMAFERDYNKNGASFVRVMKTMLMGYKYSKEHKNKFVNLRAKGYYELLKLVRAFLPSVFIFSENKATRFLLNDIRKEFRNIFGRTRIKTHFMSIIVFAFACKEYVKIKLIGDSTTPKTFYTVQKEKRTIDVLSSPFEPILKNKNKLLEPISCNIPVQNTLRDENSKSFR